MQQRLLAALIYGGGALVAAAFWATLLPHSIYTDPRTQPVTVGLFLLVAAALGCWIRPERRVTENQDLAWLGTMLEWGLVLYHLPLLPWALLQGPLLIGLVAVLLSSLGWASARFLSHLLPRRLSFRAVHALLLLLAGAVAMQGYLARVEYPPYCDDLPQGGGGRALIRFDDCIGQTHPEGLCRIPGAEIANLEVPAGGRFLVGTAIGEEQSGLFRVSLADPTQIDFISLGGLKPRALLPRDGGRVFLVVTEGVYNRMFWVEAEPFRVLQATALTVSGEEILPGPALAVDVDTLLLPAREGERALEVNTATWNVTPRQEPGLTGLGTLGDATLDPARRRVFLTWPLFPYLRVLALPGLTLEQQLPVGFGARALAIDLHADRLYVGRYLWGDAVVLDTDPFRDRGTVPLGFSVSRLALSPERRLLAGLGFATGRVDVTDLATGRHLRSWKVGRFASGLSWSADTGMFYAGSRCGVYELDPR